VLGTNNVFYVLEKHPVTVWISLHRIENEKEIKIPLFSNIGTPDVSTLVMGLAGAKKAVISSLYWFQVETIKDIPALNGVTSFFVYEELLEC